MSPLTKTRYCHFIGINHHQFHDAALVEAAVRSTAMAAKLLRDPEHRDVQIVLFYDIEGALCDRLLAEFRALGIVTTSVPFGSNGEGLNAQMAYARAQGADFFYRVDADDTVALDRFRLQASLLEQDRADICGGGLTYLNVDTQETFDVIPAQTPGGWDYITNCAMLHPTLAFRLDRLAEAGIGYWERRLEDKQLGLQIRKSGLRLRNDPVIYGHYNLVPAARTSVQVARLNLRLNWAFLIAAGQYALLPAALGLFVVSVLLPSHALRKIRQRLRRNKPISIRPDAGFGGGSGTAKTVPPPPG